MPMLLRKLTDDRVPIQPAFIQLALALIAFSASVSGRLEAARGARQPAVRVESNGDLPVMMDERAPVDPAKA